MLQTNNTGVCSQCLSHTGSAPRSLRVQPPCPRCSGSRLLRREPSVAGPGLPALPRSKPLRFRHLGSPQRWRLGWACVLCPSQIQAAQVIRCLAHAIAATYRLPTARLSRCAPVHLLRWMLTVQTPKKFQLAKKPAYSFIDNVSLGLRLSSSGSGCLSPEGDGLPPAISVQSFVPCAGLAVSQVRAGFLRGRYPTVWFASPKLFRSDSARGIQVRSLRCSPCCASLPRPRLLMADAGGCAASPLGELLQGSQCVGFNCLFVCFFPPCYVALCASKARHRFGSEKVSWCLETSLFLRLPSRDRTPSLPLLSLFLSFIFFPTSFRRVGLLFWVPDVLCRHSEVVLWNLLGV